MGQRGLLLQDVEELVASRRDAAAFPPALEERYERETGPRRARLLRVIARPRIGAVLRHHAATVAQLAVVPRFPKADRAGHGRTGGCAPPLADRLRRRAHLGAVRGALHGLDHGPHVAPHLA